MPRRRCRCARSTSGGARPMADLLALLRRDTALMWQRRGDAAQPLLFALMVCVMFPLALGSEPTRLAQSAGAVVWVAHLLGGLLVLDNLYRSDLEDGSLEQLLLAPVPLPLVIASKVLVHWLTTALPVLLITPLLAQMLFLPDVLVPVLILGLSVRSLLMSLIGAVVAALTLGIRRSGMLLALMALPMYVPVLVFGAGSVWQAAQGLPWLGAIVLMAIGIYGALLAVPADYKQGDSFRILYIHVPAAWMSLSIFVIMAIQSVIALVWRIKLCELLAMASAPVGALFTAVTLISGAVLGKPTWGTWWTWDPRLTSELVLLFLYLGVIGLYAAIEDRRAAARAADFIAIVGVVNVPIVHFAVTWWNTLHQGETIRLIGPSKMDSSMMWPLLVLLVATKLWYIGSLLVRTRVLNLQQESRKQWALERYGDLK